MLNSVEIRAALCVVLVCACNSGPEVVATQRDDVAPVADASSPLDNLAEVHGCHPGRYVGTFNSTPDGDAAPAFLLDGEFTFELVQQLHVEFLSLADGATLTGSTPTVSFSATIRGGGNCVDGAFHTTLEDGQFTVGGGASYPFQGTVDGQYSQDFRGFIGSWKVFLNNTPTTTGGYWSASLNTIRR